MTKWLKNLLLYGVYYTILGIIALLSLIVFAIALGLVVGVGCAVANNIYAALT